MARTHSRGLPFRTASSWMHRIHGFRKPTNYNRTLSQRQRVKGSIEARRAFVYHIGTPVECCNRLQRQV